MASLRKVPPPLGPNMGASLLRNNLQPTPNHQVAIGEYFAIRNATALFLACHAPCNGSPG